MPTNDTDYSCHIEVVELINQSYCFHIIPHHAASHSLRGRQTHIHTHTHTNQLPGQKRFQEIRHAYRPLAGTHAWFKNQVVKVCGTSLRLALNTSHFNHKSVGALYCINLKSEHPLIIRYNWYQDMQ